MGLETSQKFYSLDKKRNLFEFWKNRVDYRKCVMAEGIYEMNYR